MLNNVKNKEVQYILIEYKDRLARFGYNYLEKYTKDHGGEIIVLNNLWKMWFDSQGNRQNRRTNYC